MLNIEKLRKDCMQTIQSYTREQLLEWVEMDRKRMALAEQKKANSINGAPRSMPAQPRAANGQFISRVHKKKAVYA